MIADKAYDSMALRRRLQRKGIDLIAPVQARHFNNFQDGRKMRRYKRRWIIERTNAWINTIYRRLTTRWDRILTIWSGFTHIALMMICLKQLKAAGF